MRVKIYTWQKCPVCGGKFARLGDMLICPEHKTQPSKYYLKWLYQGEQFTTRPTDSFSAALKQGCEIENQIAENRFKPEQYKDEYRKRPEKYSLIYLYDEWLKQRKTELDRQQIAPGYYKSLKQYRDKYAAYTDWPTDARQIKLYHLRKFTQTINASEKTRKNVLMVLQAFMRQLYNDGFLPEMPVFPKFKIAEKLIPWIDRATQLLILQHIPDSDKPVFRFMMATGLRPSETMALRRKDIDRGNGCIHVRAGISVGQFREITKTRRQWDIPITKAVDEILKSQPFDFRTEHVFWYKVTEQNKSTSGNKFERTRFFKRYGEKKLRSVWNKACNEAGVKGVYLYAGTRHSFASQAVNEGKPLKAIGAMMGHTDDRTTNKYAHIDKLKWLKEVFE